MPFAPEARAWARLDSNQRATSYEPAALPLSYRPPVGSCRVRAAGVGGLAIGQRTVRAKTLKRPAMDDEDAKRPSGQSYALAIVPTLALTCGIPFANRVDPRIFGLPFLLGYIVLWILATPLFMYAAFRAMRVRG